jgi:hypothetical protein
VGVRSSPPFRIIARLTRERLGWQANLRATVVRVRALLTNLLSSADNRRDDQSDGTAKFRVKWGHTGRNGNSHQFGPAGSPASAPHVKHLHIGAYMNNSALGLLWIPAGFFLMLGSIAALFLTI